jgi:RNA:NAD 2'-phosphotransferase (TPT1/KptA family)
MPHQRADVNTQTEVRQLGEPACQVQLGPAAVARDDRRYAIEQEVIRARIPFDVAFHVRVDIDETRGGHPSARVDGARCR